MASELASDRARCAAAPIGVEVRLAHVREKKWGASHIAFVSEDCEEDVLRAAGNDDGSTCYRGSVGGDAEQLDDFVSPPLTEERRQHALDVYRPGQEVLDGQGREKRRSGGGLNLIR